MELVEQQKYITILVIYFTDLMQVIFLMNYTLKKFLIDNISVDQY